MLGKTPSLFFSISSIREKEDSTISFKGILTVVDSTVDRWTSGVSLKPAVATSSGTKYPFSSRYIVAILFIRSDGHTRAAKSFEGIMPFFSTISLMAASPSPQATGEETSFGLKAMELSFRASKYAWNLSWADSWFSGPLKNAIFLAPWRFIMCSTILYVPEYASKFTEGTSSIPIPIETTGILFERVCTKDSASFHVAVPARVLPHTTAPSKFSGVAKRYIEFLRYSSAFL